MRDPESNSALVHVKLLGVFYVEKRTNQGDWEPIEKTAWESSYARPLFKRLLSTRGRRATRSDIIDDLWGDNPLADRYLNNAASKLDQALGHEGLFRSYGPRGSSGYELAGQDLIWTDIDACEALMREAERRGRTLSDALSLLEQAGNYVTRGSMLEGEGGQWCLAVRTEKETVMRRCLIWLAEAYEAQHMLWNARTQYRTLLEANPLDEDILCRLLALLHRHGMTHDALACYEEATQRMTSYGLSPSPVTKTLAKRLTSESPTIEHYLTPRINPSIPLAQTTISAPLLEPHGIIEGVGIEQEGLDMDEQRRHLLQQLIELAGCTVLSAPGKGAQSTHPSPVSYEEFLMQSAASIKACWHLLKGNGLSVAEDMLTAHIPALMRLTFQPSTYQQTTAGLAAQAKILQAVVAMHRLNFVQREMYCKEAVKCSDLSGDCRMQAGALMYLGYTYTYCQPRKPQEAVTLFCHALEILDDQAPLLTSDIYMGLADAYAQCKEEQQALTAIAQAKAHFPEHPEHDPSFLYADCGWSELYQWEGKMYLDLARYFPDRGYYQEAHEAFSRSASLQSVAERSASETVIHQADAARGIGDLELYIHCLEEGAMRALSIGSQKRYSEAYEIFQRKPKQWRHEASVKRLARDVFRHVPTMEAN
jgi:DNA-binding SARP family transcriptional activator